jgi:hypothetical protein
MTSSLPRFAIDQARIVDSEFCLALLPLLREYRALLCGRRKHLIK